jgi:S1-C subfamily serine protease
LLRERIKPSIIRIRNLGCGVGVGSGVAIDETHFVTNSHVIEGSRKVQLNLASGSSGEGFVEVASPTRDLAIVRVDSVRLSPLPLLDGRVPRGTRVFIAGFPLAERYTTVRGRILGMDEILGFTSYALDAPIQQGNSGGPAVDAAGNVVAIVNSKHILKHEAYAIPADDIKKLRDGSIAGQEFVTCGTADELIREEEAA